jgi:hypothetical protein
MLSRSTLETLKRDPVWWLQRLKSLVRTMKSVPQRLKPS